MWGARCLLQASASTWKGSASRCWKPTSARCCASKCRSSRAPPSTPAEPVPAAMNETAQQQRPPAHRAGFAAIVGRPNAGKSTLLNRLVGQKVAIVASKPQTTRNRIQGIVTRENAQVVLIDTPGLHEGRTVLNRQMMREVAAALEGIDVLLLVVDATLPAPHKDDALVEKASRFAGRTILALNKVDKLPKPKLLPLLEAFQSQAFAAMVPISALEGDGCDRLLDEIVARLPENPPY